MIGGIADWLEPYHPALALRALAAGLVVTVFVVAVVPSAWGRRLGVVASGAVFWAVREGAIGRPVGLVVGAAILVTAVVPSAGDDPAVPVMVWWSLVGVWAAVPDTEPALTVAAFLTPAVAWAFRGRTVASDRAAGLAIVVATAWAGSAGRSEIVGGVACVGLLVTPVRVPTIRTLQGVAVAGVHVLAVVTASRVLTTLDRVPASIAAAALVATSGLAARWIAASVSPPGGPASRTPEHPAPRR